MLIVWKKYPARTAATKNARMMTVLFIVFFTGKKRIRAGLANRHHSPETTMNSHQTLSTLSLVELKQLAKGRRIKQYYILKRQQLIQLLSLSELPEAYMIEKLTIHQLRDMAKDKHVRGFWSLHRDELVRLLFPEYQERQPGETPPHKNEKNESHADEHNDPQKDDPQ